MRSFGLATLRLTACATSPLPAVPGTGSLEIQVLDASGEQHHRWGLPMVVQSPRQNFALRTQANGKGLVRLKDLAEGFYDIRTEDGARVVVHVPEFGGARVQLRSSYIDSHAFGTFPMVSDCFFEERSIEHSLFEDRRVPFFLSRPGFEHRLP